MSGTGTGQGANPALAPPRVERREVDDYEAHFVLRWRGARIGDASEWVSQHEDGLRFFREERLSLRRGDTVVAMVTRISVDMDRELDPRRISISQISGPSERRGWAERVGAGRRWAVHQDGEAVRHLPGDAVPAELIPLYLFAHQRAYNRDDEVFSGPVVLAGYGFALARMDVVAEDARQLVVTVRAEIPEGSHGHEVVMRGRWRTTRYGSLAAVHTEHGVSAARAHPSELAAPFSPPELVDSASIALLDMSAQGRVPTTVLIEPVLRGAPPELPGQRVEVRGRAWRVALAPGDSFAPELEPQTARLESEAATEDGDSEWAVLADDIVQRARARATMDEIVALARATDVLLDDDLGAPSSHARAALALGRGDCTAHATVFHALARARGIPVLLVTGYRLDGARLVRHRWAMVAVGGAWISVDPTYGEAPAHAGLLGLVTHGASSAELSLVDETAFAGLADAVARALQ